MPESIAITKAAFKSPERKLAASAFRAVGQGTNFWGKPAGGIWKDLWGEKKDGSRGVLRGAAEDKALKAMRTLGIDRLPPVKKYRIAKANSKRRAAALHYGHEYKPVTEAELGYGPSKGRFGLFRRKKPDTADSPIATGPSAGGSTVTASGTTTVPAGSAPTGATTPSAPRSEADIRREAVEKVEKEFGSIGTAPAGSVDREVQRIKNESGVVANNSGTGEVRTAAFEGGRAGAESALGGGTTTPPPPTGDSARAEIGRIEDIGIERGSGGDSGGEPKKDA